MNLDFDPYVVLGLVRHGSYTKDQIRTFYLEKRRGCESMPTVTKRIMVSYNEVMMNFKLNCFMFSRNLKFKCYFSFLKAQLKNIRIRFQFSSKKM